MPAIPGVPVLSPVEEQRIVDTASAELGMDAEELEDMLEQM